MKDTFKKGTCLNNRFVLFRYAKEPQRLRRREGRPDGKTSFLRTLHNTLFLLVNYRGIMSTECGMHFFFFFFF